ncbi:MAG: Asp-tRNA(Asn)/Glu-tRNA(Gln) amidotransferase subunit GatA [Ignavibacteriaceae bacterium]|nr:Asp-tRNA(Asn)/Glu-tRNA(Gln) amidotransferase subunit GatA [Ignavibacteriaceae bacterium]
MIPYANHSEKIELIKNGTLSLKENVLYFINEIKSQKELNAFNFVFEDSVLEAEIIEEKIRSGTSGKLAGMVIAVKDVISIKDKPLTCSSKMLENFNALYDATVIEKIKKEDGIIIGKTNCDEFAMGSSNENSFFGAVKNPVNNSKVPGGSSGGSAAAVAVGLCDTSLGTDTGGSIRQPASFTGIYGLKPTYGRVSRFGLTAFASSFDSIGPFAKNSYDLSLLLEVLSGHDEKDSTSSPLDVPQFSSIKNGSDKIKRIGIPKEYFGEGLQKEVREAIDKLISQLKENGFEIKEISLPNSEYTIATYYILTTAETSSNLARYDGAKYGYRSKESNNLENLYRNSRSEGFGKEVKRRIMLGTYVLSSGYYDAYYKKAQKVRRMIKNDFMKAFEEVDLILTPTSPFTAFDIGAKLSDPMEMYLSDIYTTSANLAGIPGISIPIGFDEQDLPIGVQFLANQFKEENLVAIANHISELKK